MIDQSHNLKGKVEAMVQTVVAAQELYARAALVDRAKLAGLQQECRLVEAEECFRGAFWTDVRPIVGVSGASRAAFPPIPLKALAESGYVEKITSERSSKNAKSASSYALIVLRLRGYPTPYCPAISDLFAVILDGIRSAKFFQTKDLSLN